MTKEQLLEFANKFHPNRPIPNLPSLLEGKLPQTDEEAASYLIKISPNNHEVIVCNVLIYITFRLEGLNILEALKQTLLTYIQP